MRVAIVGHFGGHEQFMDGQTVKTLTLYHALKKNTAWKIVKVDTYYKKKSPVLLLLKSIYAFITCRHIIVLLSDKGRRFYFPVLVFFKRFLRKHIWHDVVGGDLAQDLRHEQYAQRALPMFDANWVETESMKNDLEALGLQNCTVLPNFKNIKQLNKNEVKETFDEPLPICTFSRVMPEKGISIAIEAVETYNEMIGSKRFVLDIYGQVDEQYKPAFQELLKQSSSTEYRGVVEYDKSVAVLKDYYAMLFPTYWYGEGMPGTIVDSFSAAVPVIATDFAHNADFVFPYKTGLLISSAEKSLLMDALSFIDTHREKWIGMRYQCLETVAKWDSTLCCQQITTMIEGSEKFTNENCADAS